MGNEADQLSAYARFRKQPIGVISVMFILVLCLISLFAYIIAPDSSEHANQMHLSIHSKPPGFKTTMIKIPLEDTPSFKLSYLFVGSPNSFTEIPISSHRIQGNELIYTEIDSDIQKKLNWKIITQDATDFLDEFIYQKSFHLGTDRYGRDLLSRMIVGTRISLSIGFVAVSLSLIIGIFFGALAGYFGGKVDFFVVWLINIVWSIPTLLLVIAITLALGKGFWQVFVAVGLTMWVEVARVVRGQIMGLKEMQYITAARALGYSDFRIIFKHILPNITAPLIVISAANFAGAILIESGLSFLGLGAQPPMASWGGIIKDHYNYIIMGKAFLAIIPGLAIMLIVLAFMLVGNALRDALDVKQG
ncbi:MAG: ABC transporter permease [Flavobacteriales bacterium]|nr:ABC transporter permease [Flavobacteriales bacterium]